MNELEVKAQNAIVNQNEWGAPVVSNQDIIIPKILPMQGLSVAVTEGRASMGEFRDSLSNNLIGSIDKPFECIPFFLEKQWDILEEQPDGQFKWTKSIPVVENVSSPEYNDNWQWEAVVEGKKVKNVRRLNYFVLLPDEIEAGTDIPYIFSFKSTSIKEGKKLFTQMYIRNVRAGLPPPAFTITIGGARQKNTKGVFIVPTFTVGKKTTDKQLNACKTWINTIRSGKVKVDNSDLESDAEVTNISNEVGEF